MAYISKYIDKEYYASFKDRVFSRKTVVHYKHNTLQNLADSIDIELYKSDLKTFAETTSSMFKNAEKYGNHTTGIKLNK